MELVTTILNNVVMPIAAVAVVIFIIWAGFTFLQAQGKPAEIDKAKQRLLWSLIGAGVLLGAAGISAVVQSTINSLINP
jgi:type IV secretory pathway VirB2 component (pilin)